MNTGATDLAGVADYLDKIHRGWWVIYHTSGSREEINSWCQRNLSGGFMPLDSLGLLNEWCIETEADMILFKLTWC